MSRIAVDAGAGDRRGADRTAGRQEADAGFLSKASDALTGTEKKSPACTRGDQGHQA
jgi:hypothetical protein